MVQNTTEYGTEYNRIKQNTYQTNILRLEKVRRVVVRRVRLALQSWTDTPLLPTNLCCLLNLYQKIMNVNMFQDVVNRQHVRADADVLEALARRASQRGRVEKARVHHTWSWTPCPQRESGSFGKSSSVGLGPVSQMRPLVRSRRDPVLPYPSTVH